MPTTSLAAAREWRAANLEPGHVAARTMAKADTRFPAPPAPAPGTVELATLDRLALAAEANPPPFLDAIRAAMRAVPRGRRGEVNLPLAVWTALLAPFEAALAEGAAASGSDASAAMSDADADAVGLYLYVLASGEARVRPC